MFGCRMWNAVSRLFLPRQPAVYAGRQIFTGTSPLLFKFTPCLLAEPLKKKKRIDPAVLKAREDRKRRKIEKQIRRLEKNAKQLKPIDEVEVPLSILNNEKQYQRVLPALSPEVEEERALLLKNWASFKLKEHMQDMQMIDTLLYSQQRALDELRLESEELYQEAIQLDLQMVPFKVTGPVHTPPIEGYDNPDGEYSDVSRDWDKELFS